MSALLLHEALSGAGRVKEQAVDLNLHGTDDQLDAYVLGRLSGSELAELEEHLIVCPACRDRLNVTADFVTGMKEASAQNSPPPRHAWTTWLRRPVVSMTLALLAVIAVISLISTGPTRFAPSSALKLTANRGAMPATTPALELDLTLADAPPGGGVFRVEIVNATGQTVWSGLAPSTAAGVQVQAQQRLPPGDYIVRLYATSGEVLHEYGFRIR